VEVRIGIQSVPRELICETDTSAQEVERDVATALEAKSVFTLSVQKGGKVLIPADKIAYVEFVGAEARRVGFGNIT
jgi:Protein of unknown function (DUF3107)